MPASEIDPNFIETTVKRTGSGADALIPILQSVQEEYGYLPRAALEQICATTDITPAAVTGVSTFYTGFRNRPRGRHLVKVCHGTACHVKGTGLVFNELTRLLNIPENGDTDSDGLVTVEKVQCLGCCTLAPVTQVDREIYGHLSVPKLPGLLRTFLTQDAESADPPGRSGSETTDGMGEVRLCTDSCCVARGCGRVQDAVKDALTRTGIRARIKRVGCVIQCEQTPMLEIATSQGPTVLYRCVRPEQVQNLLLRHFKPRGSAIRMRLAASRLLDSILSADEAAAEPPPADYAEEYRDPVVQSFLGRQRHIATEHFGKLDPTDLDQYTRHDGTAAIRRCVTELTPEGVIDLVEQSGLRGRGGAGFPTGAKWKLVRAAPSDVKYVIANGDEGDPGAFMDRMLMESFPYRVLEGMMIAGYAVGARQGYLYVRAEYPFAVRRLEEAIQTLRRNGLFGAPVFDHDFVFDAEIRQGAGAFVCGEETALIASLEGRRGMPQLRPPFPAQSGLKGKPTLVNNVETLATLPWIIRNGPQDFCAMGTSKSKGTKVFALAGKVRQGGLVEIPMGMSIRQIVEEIGGGVPNGRRFKAVLVGGPSGGCVPARLSDIPVDYEALTEVGAIMGSGGLVVLDDSDCMVDIARYFLRFTQIESCGKCTFCRVGTRRMLDIFDDLCSGKARKNAVSELEELAGMVCKGSLCGLGRTAPNPTLSTLRYFREEYEAHTAGRCPAGKCRDMIHYEVTQACTGCTLCAQHCPANAIPMTPYSRHEIDQNACTRCDSCRQVCPYNAITIS